MDTALSVPSIGTSGHTIGNGGTTATDHEKVMMQKVRGCPINRRMPVRMSRASFVRACLQFQKLAGITSRRDTDKTSTSRMTKHGFRTNNKHICPECMAGRLIRNHKPFDAPNDKVEFVDLQPVGIKKNSKALKRQATQKLSEAEVKRIRAMHQDGYSIVAIMQRFTQVSRTTISNIVNRVTWKHI